MNYPRYSDPALEYLLDGIAWIHDLFKRCHKCHWRRAVWSYMPGWHNACEECVNRGCSCTMEPKDGNWENQDETNWEYRLDAQGRKMPCCEWWNLDNLPKLIWTNEDPK